MNEDDLRKAANQGLEQIKASPDTSQYENNSRDIMAGMLQHADAVLVTTPPRWRLILSYLPLTLRDKIGQHLSLPVGLFEGRAVVQELSMSVLSDAERKDVVDAFTRVVPGVTTVDLEHDHD